MQIKKICLQIKKICLQHHHQSATASKSAFLKFELRASERLKDVFNNEHENLYAIEKSYKTTSFKLTQQVYFTGILLRSDFSKRLTSKKIFNMKIKFNTSLVSSVIINDSFTSNKIKETNEKSYNLSKLIIEKTASR